MVTYSFSRLIPKWQLYYYFPLSIICQPHGQQSHSQPNLPIEVSTSLPVPISSDLRRRFDRTDLFLLTRLDALYVALTGSF